MAAMAHFFDGLPIKNQMVVFYVKLPEGNDTVDGRNRASVGKLLIVFYRCR